MKRRLAVPLLAFGLALGLYVDEPCAAGAPDRPRSAAQGSSDVGYLDDPSFEAKLGRIWTLRLRPHEPLQEHILRFAVEHHVHAGFVLSAVGSLERVAIRYANQPDYATLLGHFEAVSLSGTFSDSSGAHLHIAVADSTGRSIGGHLGNGSVVYTTMEIVVGEAKDQVYAREPDPTYGYHELNVRSIEPDGRLGFWIRAPHQAASGLPWRAERVLRLRGLEEQGDLKSAADYFAPDSRVWFEAKTGPGEPRSVEGRDAFADWDRYFHAEKSVEYWTSGGDSVEFRLVETNDFYKLLDRPPGHARLVYWFDADDRITGTLVQSIPPPPGAPAPSNRMPEFKAWEAARDPGLLAWLLPHGRLDSDLAHARRWRRELLAWRRAAGLPEVKIPAP